MKLPNWEVNSGQHMLCNFINLAIFQILARNFYRLPLTSQRTNWKIFINFLGGLLFYLYLFFGLPYCLCLMSTYPKYEVWCLFSKFRPYGVQRLKEYNYRVKAIHNEWSINGQLVMNERNLNKPHNLAQFVLENEANVLFLNASFILYGLVCAS